MPPGSCTNWPPQTKELRAKTIRQWGYSSLYIGCPKIMLPFSKFYQTIKTYAKWTLACLFIELNSWSFWWHSQFFNCRQHAWCRPLFVQWRPACAIPFSPWERAFTCRPCCSPDTSRTCCSITTEPISMKLLANLYQCFVCIVWNIMAMAWLVLE